MNLQDIMAGLAGGLQGASAGLGQINDLRQQQIRQQLQQRQLDMEQEQRKRQAVYQARQLLDGGMEVPQEQLKAFSEYPEFLAGITKDPTTGKAIVQKTPQQQMIDRQLEQVQQELDIKKDAMSAQEEWDQWGQEIFNQPIEYRLGLANRIRNINPKLEVMTPQQNLDYNEKIEVQKARTQGLVQAAMIRAQQQAQNFQQRTNAPLNWEQAMQIVAKQTNKWGQALPIEEQMSMAQQLMANDPNRTSQSPQQSNGPAIGTVRTINGVQARWDGRGWLPQ